MFGFLSGVPSRLRHVLSRFKRYFTRPQYDNFCRVMMGLIVAGEGEHDVKSINELFIERKDQSSLNRFFTDPRWDVERVVEEGGEDPAPERVSGLSRRVEYKIIDDTVCRKYGDRAEMVCYNHSSTMGTIFSHDYVTSLYVNGDVAVPDGLKLYGNEERCREKRVEFKTKVQLVCEMIDEHIPRAERTIWLWDSWYTTSRHRGQVQGARIRLDRRDQIEQGRLLRWEEVPPERATREAQLGGEVLRCLHRRRDLSVLQVRVFTKKLGDVSIVFNVKADTDDVHILCTEMRCSTEKIVEHALKRHHIEEFHKGAKHLGLGEYRFRESEAALTHAHLVSLTYTLLDVLRRRLLRYGIVKGLLSLEGTVDWVRRKAMHLFIHAIKESSRSARSLFRTIDTT